VNFARINIRLCSISNNNAYRFQTMIFRFFTIALIFGFAFAFASASKMDADASQARSGPFVETTRSLTELANDGYEIRGNLGTALILQKGGSIFSCQVPPDPEKLSYKPYFICSELREEKR
jgi:hypothetical protein